MAPTETIVEWQTSEIIKYLFDDEDNIPCDRANLHGTVECDGPEGSSDDNFDPVLIADKLRSVADALNDNPRFKAALTELKQGAAHGAAEKAFGQCVEAVCQTQVSQKAEVAQEMQIIRASVAFGLYVKKSCPDLKSHVQTTMLSFLNKRVGKWITQQGGWDKVV